MTLEDNKIRAAEYVRVVDGDTFLADMITLDTGTMELRWRVKIRVHNFNADELSQPEGPHMRDVFESALKGATVIRLFTHGMSHDRIVCDVWLDGKMFAGILTSALMRLRGQANG